MYVSEYLFYYVVPVFTLMIAVMQKGPLQGLIVFIFELGEI